jgi:hypothetical protein
MSNTTILTVKQLKTIELLAIGEMTNVQIAAAVPVNVNTISKWKREPAFMEAVVLRSRELLKENLPEIYLSLTKKSKQGNDRHIKIFLDHIEKLEAAKSTQTSITFTWKTRSEEDGEL